MSFLKNFFAPKETIDFYDDFQDIISYKKNYCKSILSYLDNATICFNDFLIRIKNIASNLEYITVSTEEQDIHNLLKSIHEGIIEKFEVSIKIFVELSNHFSQFKGNLEEEAQIYKNYKDAFINLKKEKVKLEKSKNKYHDLGKEMEYKIIQFVGNNFHVLNQINQQFEDLKTSTNETNDYTCSNIDALSGHFEKLNKSILSLCELIKPPELNRNYIETAKYLIEHTINNQGRCIKSGSITIPNVAAILEAYDRLLQATNHKR